MNLKKSIAHLTKLQRNIWLVSFLAIFISFVIAGGSDVMTVIASLVGATALIFLANGDAFGQLLTMVFAVLYAIVSFQFRYYGEMLTYVCMTLPTAAIAMINWLKNPYAECEVKVSTVSKRAWFFLSIGAVIVTFLLGMALKYFHTANLLFSTLSVTTSFVASALTALRSPYYAVAYACNDIILIILWTLATVANIQYLPMIICFVVFLVNDIYAFINWQMMQKRQALNC